jgi:hypothetical protein
MASLSSAQRTDLRADIGDDGTVFTNDELDRLYTRAESNYDLAVVLALRQLLANAAKLHDYRLAQSMENMSQVFGHLKHVLAYRENVVVGAQRQVKLFGARRIPPPDREEPNV